MQLSDLVNTHYQITKVVVNHRYSTMGIKI